MTETFIEAHSHTIIEQVEPVTIDDASAFLARFPGHSLATFERPATRAATRRCTRFEINGADASIMWDLQDLHRLQYFDHDDEGRVRGWRSLHVTDSGHPYMKHWWVPGLQIGYEHTFIHQVADFLEALAGGKRPAASPTFKGGARDRLRYGPPSCNPGRSGLWEQVRRPGEPGGPLSRSRGRGLG